MPVRVRSPAPLSRPSGGILGIVDQPAAIDIGSGRVYDAGTIDTYIQHLHTRIASLNDQLHDAHERTRRAEALVRGTVVDDFVPNARYEVTVDRAFTTSPRRPPSEGDLDLHDEFWSRDGHLEMLEDETFLSDLRDEPPRKRRRRFART
jgi:hypothetical protein